MALLVRINEVFTDNTLPVLPVVDAMESAGSLVLIDAKRSIASAANGALAVNLLNKPGVVDVPNLQVFTNVSASDFTSTLTGCGGLRFRPRPYGSKAHLGGALKLPDTKLLMYLKNCGHRVYMSWWGRCVDAFSTTDASTLRAQSQKSAAHMVLGNSLSGNIRLGIAYTTFESGAQTLSLNATGTTNAFSEGHLGAVGNVRTVACFVPPPNMDVASMTVDHLNVFAAGGAGALNYNLLQQTGVPDVVKMPAMNFYRFYVEDLELSGRTYEEVKAIDDALYNTEMVEAGGKYVGESEYAVAAWT